MEEKKSEEQRDREEKKVQKHGGGRKSGRIKGKNKNGRIKTAAGDGLSHRSKWLTFSPALIGFVVKVQEPTGFRVCGN